MIKNIFLVWILVLCAFSGQGQKLTPQVVASAGNVSKAGGFSIEWTLGELVTERLTNGNSKLTQGFHQGNLVISSVSNPTLEGINIYPNPVSDELVVENNSGKEVQFDLFDLNGRLVETQKLAFGQHKAQMHSLANGSYIIQISSGNLKSVHQIQKIK